MMAALSLSLALSCLRTERAKSAASEYCSGSESASVSVSISVSIFITGASGSSWLAAYSSTDSIEKHNLHAPSMAHRLWYA